MPNPRASRRPCASHQRDLARWLELDSPTRQLIVRHAGDCAGCAVRLAAARALEERLGQLAAAHRGLRSQTSFEQVWGARRPRFQLALVAAVVVALPLLWLVARHPAPWQPADGSSRGEVSSPADERAVVAAPGPESLSQLGRLVRSSEVARPIAPPTAWRPSSPPRPRGRALRPIPPSGRQDHPMP